MRAGARALAATALVAAGSLLLAGCTGTAAPGTDRTVTVTASAPTPASTTTAPATTTATATPTAGCRNGGSIPVGADTARIGDVDGDGRADTEFYSEHPHFEYGIATAAGGVYALPDPLPGPATHSGWTAVLADPRIAVTVLDDDRQAALHAFVDCRFVTTRGVDGKPYVFGLNGFYTAGTGVACDDGSAGPVLEGALVVRRGDGRSDVRWTEIHVSADGARATNGDTITRYSDLASDDPRVQAANTSVCNAVPKVHSSGE